MLACYVKGRLKLDILDSDVPEDPYLASALERAFPARLCERFRDRLAQHALRRELDRHPARQRRRGPDGHHLRRTHAASRPTRRSPRSCAPGWWRATCSSCTGWWEAVEALDNRVAAERAARRARGPAAADASRRALVRAEPPRRAGCRRGGRGLRGAGAHDPRAHGRLRAGRSARGLVATPRGAAGCGLAADAGGGAWRARRC